MSLVGEKVGSIRIVGLLGEGGMGAVYSGFDEKLRRDVALKAIRGDEMSPVARTRFLREARTLSQLDHPNICGIYNYIERGGRDFLVLELVQGTNLRDALAAGLDGPARLKIAEQVANALVAAHAKGIVHRDLKVSNLMLTPDGTVKVLDFGLARAASALSDTPIEAGRWGDMPDDAGFDTNPAEAPTREIETRLGNVVGTLHSMSPEQARGEPITTASDMFSFGLLLQELFTGLPAYDPNQPLRLLMDKVQHGETLPVEGLDPHLTELIGRLESLAPEARPTAAQALERLRWIREKPRRRAFALIATGVALLLLLLAVLHTVRLQRERDLALAARRDAEQARAEAERARREAEEVSDFLVGLFAVSDPGEARGNQVTARELLDRGAESVRYQLREQPLQRARMMDAIGLIYIRLGLYRQARPLLEEALALRQAGLGKGHPDVAATLTNLGVLTMYTGQDAEPLFRRALAIQEKTLGPDDLEVARTLNRLGTFYAYQSRAREGEPLLERALRIRERVLGPDHPKVAETLNNLAFAKLMLGEKEQAEKLLRRGLTIREKVLPADHPDLASNLEALAVVYQRQRRSREALPLLERSLVIFRKTLGPEHPRTLQALSNFGMALAEVGRSHEAEAVIRQVLTLRVKVLGPDHPDCEGSRGDLADIYLVEKRYADAEPLYRRVVPYFERTHGIQSGSTISYGLGYSQLLRETGRPAEAKRLEERLKLPKRP